MNPFNPAAPNRDPVEAELARLQLKGYDVQPGFVSKRITVLGQPVDLRREQERQYQSVAGSLTYSLLASFVGMPEWDALSDAQKTKAIDRLTTRIRTQVREQMQPQLVDQAVDAKVKELKKTLAPTP